MSDYELLIAHKAWRRGVNYSRSNLHVSSAEKRPLVQLLLWKASKKLKIVNFVVDLHYFSVSFYFYNLGKLLQDFLGIKRLPYCLATVAETNVSANSETLRAFKLKIKNTHNKKLWLESCKIYVCLALIEEVKLRK